MCCFHCVWSSTVLALRMGKKEDLNRAGDFSELVVRISSFLHPAQSMQVGRISRKETKFGLLTPGLAMCLGSRTISGGRMPAS